MSTREGIKIEVDDDELRAVNEWMDELIAKKVGLTTPRDYEGFGDLEAVVTVADVVDMEVQITVERLTGELEAVVMLSDLVDSSVQETVDRLTAEILALDMLIEQTDASLMTAFMGMDLPSVDRGTRMLLLRVPGLRELLRLLYIISMTQRSLRLGGVRGPVTAAITSALYVYMAFQLLERRQARLEARLNAIQRDTDRRNISLEEAVRRFGMLPERYRATVPP